MPPEPLFIAGEWVQSAQQIEVRLPYDGSLTGTACEASPGQLDAAVRAAQAAGPAMEAMSNAERADLLTRVHAGLLRDQETLARLLTLETGKPIRESRVETDRALQTLVAAADAARGLRGEAIAIDSAPAGKGRMAMTIRQPLGVVAAVTPFNVPLNLALHKVAPALAAGNAVVHKPAERTPLSALHLARLFEEAGVPKGAYNVVNGSGPVLAPRLAAHEGVDMLTFTGSVPVGRMLREAAGWKRVTLELGNNSALLIHDDADLPLAAERATAGGFAHSGQLCIAVQRILVHRRVAGEFLDRFLDAVKALRIGHPLEESTTISSLITEQAARRVEEWIGEAVAGGAVLHCGGARAGATVSPAVLTGVAPGARLNCEEAFGPVVSVAPYDDLDAAVAEANNTPFGLQAGVFTRDLERAFRVARRLRVGGVIVNDAPTFRADPMPYGGVKQSGIGREGPRYAIEEMSESKLICWRV